MIQNKKTAGFTLIELMIVVAIIAIIASIAIPKLFSARISANENGAIATLRSVASAQAQMQSSSAIDCDGDGGGEYAYFGELAGIATMRVFNGDPLAPGPEMGDPLIDVLDPPILPTAFGDIEATTAGDGVVERAGYFFQMWLPGVNNLGVIDGQAEKGTGGSVDGAFPLVDSTEILWACYAWPVEATKTGNRVFFINQEGDLLQFDNREAIYSGIDAGPGFVSAYGQDEAGVNHMGSPMGITAMGQIAGDAEIWTVVGN